MPKDYIGFQGGNRRRRRVAALYDARFDHELRGEPAIPAFGWLPKKREIGSKMPAYCPVDLSPEFQLADLGRERSAKRSKDRSSVPSLWQFT
jgi:hypothetical protein